MVLRLSELLERIRPTGAPGAPTEGEGRRRREHRAGEVAAVTSILSSFEADADALVAAARAQAEQVRAEGERRARDVRAALPERLAVAEAREAHAHEGRDRVEMGRLRDEADETVGRLRERADAEVPRLVDEVTEIIWSQVRADAVSEHQS
jgi:hypothetical protein